MTYSQSNGIILNVSVDIHLSNKSSRCFNAVATLRVVLSFASENNETRLKQLKEINQEIKDICQEELTRKTLTKLSTETPDIVDIDFMNEVSLLQNLGATLDLLFRLDFYYKKEAEADDQKELLEECIETLVEALEYFVGQW